MAIDVLTDDEVQRRFAQGITHATKSSALADQQEVNRLFQTVVSPTWQQASAGVEQLTINTALSLVRGHLRVTIDKHQDGQSQTIQGQIDDFASRLASLVPTGATVRWVFEFPPTKDVPFGQEVECMVQGIVERASADG